MSSPQTVGALWPSSSHLAHAIAAQVPLDGKGQIVEIGAGTGVVTQALLDRGIAATRLWVIERSAPFVAHLRQRFPHVHVLHADAVDLCTLLPAGADVDAIVSSLPLLSLPADAVTAIITAWRQLLQPGHRVVQFTYALRKSASDERFHGFAHAHGRIVWRNLPPARVMVLERES